MKKALLLCAALLLAGCGEKSSDSVTLPLSDANVERLLKEAVALSSLEGRDGLRYQVNESEPYSGWAKRMYFRSEQIWALVYFKDGKLDGLATSWYENGQKKSETTYKDGESVSQRSWPSNGREGN